VFLFYGDESGYTGVRGGAAQPVLVVAGVLVNTHGASKTRREYRELLAELGELAHRDLSELKGQELFRGTGTWNGVGHGQRAAARARILEWLAERGHKVVASGLTYDRLDEARQMCPGLAALTPRAIVTLHTALSIQRAKHSTRLNEQRKNATLLFYDEQPQANDQTTVASAIATPPDWALEFVGDRHAGGELTAIVDTAYFVDSEQAPMIQIADFVAYMIQRKAALDEGAQSTFNGEPDVVNGIFDRLQPLLLDRSHRLPRQPPTAVGAALRSLSPTCLD
jgi:Protein of unknown function (DUF3800)